MTPGSGPPRAAHDLMIAALGYTATAAAIAAIAAIAVAVPTLVAGSVSPVASFVVTVLMLASSGAVLIVRQADLSVTGSTRLRLAIGIGAAGATTAVIAAFLPGITEAIETWLVLIVAAVAIAVVALAWPVAGWLVSADRLRSISLRIVRPMDGDPERPRDPDLRPTVTDWAILGTGVVALFAGLMVVIPSGPFGHDESIYALKAREWVSGTPATGWAEYRPIGMSIVGWLVLQFSSSEVWFRLAAVGLSITTVATMWFAGRVMFGTAAATLGAAVFLSTESFLRRATEFLNDVVAAGLLLATMVAIWVHFEHAPGRWWLVAAGPLAAGAYYMRYGSALGLAIIALVSAAIWFRQIRSSWRQIVVTGLVTLLLLLPHFLQSTALTGSPLGIFESARTSVGGGGGGLADYLRWLPSRLAGPVGTALLAMGVIYAIVVIVAAVRGRPELAREARTVGYLAGTALILALALGAFTHGEPRFLYLPLMLGLLLGARASTLVWSMLRRSPRQAVSVAVGLVLAGGFVAGSLHMGRALDGITNSREVIVGASVVAKEYAEGRACEVRSSYIPQITWYAECSTYRFTAPLPEVRPAFLVLFENGKRQPEGADLEREISETDNTLLVVVEDPEGTIGDGSVFIYP